MLKPTWTRVDPLTCGCTDCLTGYSIPLGLLSSDDLDWIATQQLDDKNDATGLSERGWDAVAGDDVDPSTLVGVWWAWVS